MFSIKKLQNVIADWWKTRDYEQVSQFAEGGLCLVYLHIDD